MAAIGLTIVARANRVGHGRHFDGGAGSQMVVRARSNLLVGEGSWSTAASRATDVAMMESADLGQRNDATLLGWLNGARLGRILLECEMGA